MCEYVENHRGTGNFEIDSLHEFVKKLSGKNILDDDYSMMKIILKEV